MLTWFVSFQSKDNANTKKAIVMIAFFYLMANAKISYL